MAMLRREDSAAPAEAQDAEPTTEGRRHTFISGNPFSQQQDKTPKKPRDWGYGTAITLAFAGIIAVSAMTIYVSYEAQLVYTEDIKGDAEDQSLANQLAAASWDVAAAVFAVLALATAMRGDNPLRARIGNILCAAASVLMNGARFAPPEMASALDWIGHLIVWVGPALLYAGTTDTIVLEIQRRSLERRSLDLEHTSIWSVLAIIVGGAFGVLLWFGRFLLAPRETTRLARAWYLKEIAYAPGRTLEGDKAREALEAAAEAEGVAEEIERRSEATIAEARADYAARANAAEEKARREIEATRAEEKARADEGIRSERQRATKAIEAERKRATEAVADAEARVKELQDGHAQTVQRLQDEYVANTRAMQDKHSAEVADLRSQLERAGTDAGAATAELRNRYDRELTELRNNQRAEMQRMRDHAAVELERKESAHRTQLEHKQHELVESSRRASELEAVNRALGEELEFMRQAASSKMRMRWLYRELGRQGDPRYGDKDHVREIAHELMPQAGMSVNSIGTAVGYLHDYLKESQGQGLKTGVNGREEHVVAGLT